MIRCVMKKWYLLCLLLCKGLYAFDVNSQKYSQEKSTWITLQILLRHQDFSTAEWLLNKREQFVPSWHTMSEALRLLRNAPAEEHKAILTIFINRTRQKSDRFMLFLHACESNVDIIQHYLNNGYVQTYIAAELPLQLFSLNFEQFEELTEEKKQLFFAAGLGSRTES